MEIVKVPGNLFKHIPTKYGDLLLQHNYVNEDDSPWKVDFVIEFKEIEGIRSTLSLAFNDEVSRNEAYEKVTSEHAESMIESAWGMLKPAFDEAEQEEQQGGEDYDDSQDSYDEENDY
jgi:hypothetical protein